MSRVEGALFTKMVSLARFTLDSLLGSYQHLLKAQAFKYPFVLGTLMLSGYSCVMETLPKRFPPRTRIVQQTLDWNGLVLRLPPKWKGIAGKTLAWVSLEDTKCRAELTPVLYREAKPSQEELISIAQFLGCQPEMVCQRKGFFEAEIFYFERRDPQDDDILITQSLVRCDGKYFKHSARYPYRTSLEKIRGAELWMILYWFGKPDVLQKIPPVDRSI